MGLLEYQAMLSLRDVAHDGVLFFYVHLVIDQPQTGPSGVVRPPRKKSHSAGSLCFSQPVGPPCLASLLTFGLIGTDDHFRII